jgi:hypothetical protein
MAAKLRTARLRACATRATGLGYVEFGPIMRLAESLGADASEGYREAKHYLRAFARLIAGAQAGDGLTSRLLIELR